MITGFRLRAVATWRDEKTTQGMTIFVADYATFSEFNRACNRFVSMWEDAGWSVSYGYTYGS